MGVSTEIRRGETYLDNGAPSWQLLPLVRALGDESARLAALLAAQLTPARFDMAEHGDTVAMLVAAIGLFPRVQIAPEQLMELYQHIRRLEGERDGLRALVDACKTPPADELDPWLPGARCMHCAAEIVFAGRPCPALAVASPCVPREAAPSEAVCEHRHARGDCPICDGATDGPAPEAIVPRCRVCRVAPVWTPFDHCNAPGCISF